MTAPAVGAARSFDRVLAELQRVRRTSATQATALCPAHDDHNHPSLSVTYLPGERRVLLHCFAVGCSATDITAAIGLEVSDLWDDPLRPCEVCGKDSVPDAAGRYIHDHCAGREPQPRRPRTKVNRLGRLPAEIATPDAPQREVVSPERETARYEHIDLNGEVVAASVRYESVVLHADAEQQVTEKTFRQEYTDGRGGWISHKPAGLRVPLWRLPEIRAAARTATPVYLVEGHKDALAVEQAGALATTNIAGALGFTAEDAEDLRNVIVRVVCDRDLAGYERGARIARLLHGVATAVELYLPATTTAKSDTYDHLGAGFGLDQLVPVTAERLEALAMAEQVKDKVSQLVRPDREARARWARAAEDAQRAPKRASEDQRLAQRWVADAAARVEQIAELVRQLAGSPHATPAETTAARGALQAAAGQVAELHALCGVDPSASLTALLGRLHGEDPAEDSDDDEADVPDNVVRFVSKDPGEGPPAPARRIPIVDRDEWRYSDGTDNGFARAVYKWQRGPARGMPGHWAVMAPLPFVHARVNRRDGSGHRERTDYLLSVDEQDRPKTFHRDSLKTGQWANTLGVQLAFDAKIVAAAATAIDDMASRAPVREATPQVNPDTGLLDLPAEPLDQYFECSPLDPEVALDRWRDIVDEASIAPKLALAMGASAIAPFVRELGLSAHTFSMTGAAGQGKTIALAVVAGIWGDVTRHGRMFSTWNTSTQGLPGELGETAILPCYRDEFGLGNLTKAQTASFIYQIAEGTSRTRLDRNYDPKRSRSWKGIFFSTGNGKLTDGIDAGSSQGIPRRVVELSTPISVDSAQGLRLFNADVHRPSGLVQQAYGHLGKQIAETVTITVARGYLLQAYELMSCPEGEVELVARHLYGHIAGALMIDDLLGTEQMLTQAAVACAEDYLASWAPPKSEADRILELVEDSLASHLTAWPTREQYIALQKPKDFPGSAVPMHGFDRQFMGLRDEESGWVAVFPWAWKAFVAEADINSSLACQQLEERGILRRPAKARSNGEYQTLVAVYEDGQRRVKRMYQLHLPDPDTEPLFEDDFSGPNPAPEAVNPSGVTGAVTGVTGAVTGSATGADTALTRGVTGVTGESDQHLYTRVADHFVSGSEAGEDKVATAPIRWLDRAGTVGWASAMETAGVCVVCGVRCTMTVGDLVIHPPCWERTTRQERARLLAQREVPAEEEWVGLAKPWPGCAVCDQPASHARHGVPLHAGECVEAFDAGQTRPAPKSAAEESPAAGRGEVRASGRARGERFAADSAVLDATTAWLSNGARSELPAIRHAGDLAEWAVAMRLGFGGTARHLPEPGRVWLDVDLCDRLGLPVEAFESMEDAAAALTAARQTEFFQGAVEAGWTIAGAEDKPWVKLHQGSKSVVITGVSWGAGRYDALLADQPSASELAGRLGLLCRTVGFPYTVTPAMTGLNSMEYMLADGLPKVPVPDVPYNDIAANPSWISLEAIEAADPQGFVHVYDRRKSFLAGAGNALVGDGAFIHHPTGCDWDPAVAGFYRVEALGAGEQPLPFLGGFDVLNPASVPGGSSGWVSAAAMAFLQQLGVPVRVAEAITWPVGGRRLKSWQAHIKQAGETLEQLAAQGDPAATALLANRIFKGIYTDGFGALARTDFRSPLEPARRYRPHWRAEIIGTHTANTLRAVKRIHDASTVSPVAIGLTDAIAYLGRTTDPADAWPGQGSDSLTNPALGKFKPAGYMRIGEWLEAMADNANARRPVSQIRLVLDRGHRW